MDGCVFKACKSASKNFKKALNLKDDRGKFTRTRSHNMSGNDCLVNKWTMGRYLNDVRTGGGGRWGMRTTTAKMERKGQSG